jgi:hypothetical protein
MGVKQWSAKLTPPQREVLSALPTGAPNRVSVVEAHHALVRAFRLHAREACTTLGVAWPDELEAATNRYLASHGVDVDG